METSPVFWVIFNSFIVGMIWLDLKVFHKSAHAIKGREALGWSIFWIILSLVYALGLYLFVSPDKSLEFLSGYIVEKSLSIDNIFVFSLIFRKLSIPLPYQHRVLFWGILSALVLRGLMIGLGITLLAYFHALIYILGGFLLFTGLKMLWMTDKPLDLSFHPLMLFLKRYIPLTSSLHGQNLLVRAGPENRWHATPLLASLALVEFSDLIFALDSVPAIFAITLDPFIVYTSTVFAILGLRSLYFLLADALERFIYLKSGVILILCFVGAKMLVADLYKIPAHWTLGIIVLILGGSILLSFFQRSHSCPK